MSSRSLNKSAKKRSHEPLERRQLNVSKCDDESRSSSCCSKKSNKRLLKHNKSDEDFFNVEKITGLKVVQGRSFYKVRWQGYDECEDSWEPEDNLENVMDLIEEFLISRGSIIESDENGKGGVCNRSRTTGGFEYVPSNKVVAHKTKYFDDIRDGKIDLTKNDLYSRVKTRKRLQSDTTDAADVLVEGVDLTNEDCSVGISEISVVTESTSCDKNKYYQSNLFEMTAEFMKNNNFDKCLTTVAEKSSTNDDISSFNYSISPNTEHSDDLMLQISPGQSNFLTDCSKNSVATQTELSIVDEEGLEVEVEMCEPECEEGPRTGIELPSPVSAPPRRLVTSEAHLMSIYMEAIKASDEAANLPAIQNESDQVHVSTLEDLRSAIVLNRYSLVQAALESGAVLDIGGGDVDLLRLAVVRNQGNMVRLLLRYGYPSEGVGSGESPLIAAVRLGNVHCLRALLDHGVDIDRRSPDGRNALCVALEQGRTAAVRLLLGYGADTAVVMVPVPSPGQATTASALSLLHDLLNAHTLPQSIATDLLAILQSHQKALFATIDRSVTRTLARLNLHRNTAIFPPHSLSARASLHRTQFLLDDAELAHVDCPLLFLPHLAHAGDGALVDPSCWLADGLCLVQSVLVNGRPQSPLSGLFLWTLWPLHRGTNTVEVRLIDGAVLAREERRVRVALVGVSASARAAPLPSLID